MPVKKVLGLGAAAAVLAIGFVPANAAPSESAPTVPDTSAAAIGKTMAKANDSNSVLLEGLSDFERELSKVSNAKSVLLDAKTGVVLSVGEGDFVPK